MFLLLIFSFPHFSHHFRGVHFLIDAIQNNDSDQAFCRIVGPERFPMSLSYSVRCEMQLRFRDKMLKGDANCFLGKFVLFHVSSSLPKENGYK